MPRSRDACALSILKLANTVGAEVTYLHTFTFPEPQPDQKTAAKRWRAIYFRLRRLGHRGVWALQRGRLGTARLHYHVISVERWDAAQMWALLPRYGFGRYDVRPPRAVCFASYIARYVGNSPNLEPGTRTWACFGFKGVRTHDVVYGSIAIDSVVELPRWLISQLQRISLRDDTFSKRKAFVEKRWSVPLVLEHMNEIKTHQHEEIIKDAQAGLYAICVGEYRGFTVTAGKKMDKVSGTEKGTVRVEHTVLCGTEQVRFTEFLPPGAAGDAVKPAAESGEMVICRVTEWRRNPQTAQIQARGFIKPLMALAIKTAHKA